MPLEPYADKMDDVSALSTDLVHLARLALTGREQDVTMFVQRAARRLRHRRPEVANELVAVLREAPTRSSPLRREAAVPLPVDLDSRLALLRVEHPDQSLRRPILPEHLDRDLGQVIAERQQEDRLLAAGLAPTRTLLFVGPPGVGKTMGARWLAAELRLPLLVLDLTAVMSSLLGRTGANLRHVIEYAKSERCVLLLDEFDSIAKRRDDDADVGELKRLVTVLLQQVDDWPSHAGLLVAATNHPELLDPAVWRRFDSVVDFPLPDATARREAVMRYGGHHLSPELANAMVLAMEGRSFNDIERELARARRAATLADDDPAEALLLGVAERIRSLPASTRRVIAEDLVRAEIMSQRRVHELTGVSRDTIRKDVSRATRKGSIRA